LEQISLVARRLRNHRDLISRLSENKQHANHRGGALPFYNAQYSVPNEGVFGPVASAEHDSSGYRDPPLISTIIPHASRDRSGQLVNEELNGLALPEGAIARNNLQQDGSWPENNATPGFRLHVSDFIQSLSE
jgi:hypothetical protein